MRPLEIAAPASGPGDRRPSPAAADTGPGTAGRPIARVLITEDNWLIASEWEEVLTEAGYDVTGIAVSADEAVAACANDPPDFVLMDIRLLGPRDGVDTARELRARFGIASVFVTAHDDPDTRARGAAARPLGWITKPFLAGLLPGMLAGLSRPLS